MIVTFARFCATCRSPALLVALLAAGCERPAASPVETADGVVSAELVWQSADAAAGGVDFGRIGPIAGAGHGDVWAADGQARTVSVFDSAGRFLRRIGRDGEGPGEFRWLAAIGTGGDTVHVLDARLWRMTSFVEGRVARIESVPAESDFGQPMDFAFTGDGRLVHLGFDRYQESLIEGMAGRRHGLVRGTVTLQRWSPGDSAWTVIAAAPGLEVFVDMDEGSLSDPWFARSLLWAPGPDGGVWTGDTENGALVRWAADGLRMAEARVAIEPEPVTDADRAAFANAEDVADTAARPARRQQRRGIELPPTKPVLRSMLPTPSGGVILAERLPGENDRLPGVRPAAAVRRWFEYDAAGRLLAILEFPVRSEPRLVLRDIVLAVGRDSLDVERVQQWRRRR